MKCLTLTQPYASLVAVSAKKIETRSWYTPYRGPLAIHAAKGMPFEAAWEAFYEPQACAALRAAGYRFLDDLERGAVVATCRLVDCVPTTAIERTYAVDWISEQEMIFSDLSDGRCAWLLADVVALAEPIPARGYLWLWDWDESALGRMAS